MRRQYASEADSAETIAYSGPQLAGLLATSSGTLIAAQSFENVESTVVIAGRRPALRAPEPSSWGTTGAVAFSVSQAVPVPDGARVEARPFAGLLVAGVGLLIGLVVTPVILAELPPGLGGTHLAGRGERREAAVEATSLVSGVRQKSAARRKPRGRGAVAHAAAHAAVSVVQAASVASVAPMASAAPVASVAPVAAVAPPPAGEAGDDTPTAADLKLLLAAQAERPL